MKGILNQFQEVPTTCMKYLGSVLKGYFANHHLLYNIYEALSMK